MSRHGVLDPLSLSLCHEFDEDGQKAVRRVALAAVLRSRSAARVSGAHADAVSEGPDAGQGAVVAHESGRHGVHGGAADSWGCQGPIP